ncbi:MAG: hypothetical protein J0M08_06925 [Bacteroidetes bacterium]|nr:hypothetical protein [Bacteroidota bacterium]
MFYIQQKSFASRYSLALWMKCMCFMFNFLCCTALAQVPTWKSCSIEQATQVIKSSFNWFSSEEAISVVTTHTTYQNFETKIPYEKHKGFYKKYKNNYHSLISGIHTIQNDKYRLVVDTVTKQIMLANASDLAFFMEDNQTLQERLKLCTQVEELQTPLSVYYRLQYPQTHAVLKMEVEIGKDGRIKEVVYFLNQEIKNEDQSSYSVINPRLSIMFSNYKSQVAKSEFDEQKYISWAEKKPVLKEKYRDFDFFDARVQE